ncbi:hypothetical protein BRD00_12005 [Halobacteriales archaeon QS_8_69_26]|nr:MAG: hypothetical protein BRD00_12005 [Halobacteriales archaeon QS_8_69_26]
MRFSEFCGSPNGDPPHARVRGWYARLTAHYSGSEAKAHPFTGGMKPTTGNLSMFVATTGVRCMRNIFR